MGEAPTVDKVRMDVSRFDIFDYIVFVGMLLGCALIGLYYSLFGKKVASSANEYLIGGRKLSTFPVATSLIASYASGITLLGVPAEIYLYGTGYTFAFIPIFLTGFVSSYFILPVFYEMRLLSIYEYLERRFDSNVRFFGSLMFMIAQIFWLPIVVYIPALAFNQVTGVNIHIVTPYVCLLSVFYTCLGGLKAIVWTDVVQTLFMVSSMILICTKGSLDMGGFQEVWQRNYESGRLVFPTFDGDLTIRHSFWAITFGGLIMWVQWSVIDQNVVQKYFSLPSLSDARRYVTPRIFGLYLLDEYLRISLEVRALWIFVIGTIGLILVCCYSGLVIYATYRDCDPLTTKLAKAKDQLLPLSIMRISANLPGLPGLFVAGIFSASLSSVSTGLNSLSAVVLEDFIKPFLKKDLSARATDLIVRGVVVIFGIAALLLVLILEKLGTILQLGISLGSITSGPVFGLFLSGVFLPWVNAKGALFGGLLSLFASGFVIIGAQNAATRNEASYFPKPTSVEGCLYYYNATVFTSSLENSNKNGAVFPLFRLSYLWYTAFGGFITITLAVIISALTGFTDLRNVDPIWFSPIIRSLFPLSENLRNKEKFLMKKLIKNRG